jgi:hypothetical protein
MEEAKKSRIPASAVPKNILRANALICGALSIRNMTSKPQYLVFLSLDYYYMPI